MICHKSHRFSVIKSDFERAQKFFCYIIRKQLLCWCQILAGPECIKLNLTEIARGQYIMWVQKIVRGSVNHLVNFLGWSHAGNSFSIDRTSLPIGADGRDSLNNVEIEKLMLILHYNRMPFFSYTSDSVRFQRKKIM